MRESYDVIVVGGGAAGLSGALMLGRSRRSVLVIDAGDPRNAPADGVRCPYRHGWEIRDQAIGVGSMAGAAINADLINRSRDEVHVERAAGRSAWIPGADRPGGEKVALP